MTGINLTLAQAAKAVGFPGQVAWSELPLSGVSTDSRTIKPGELFVALKGDRFDGHVYLKKAFAAGAAAAVVAVGTPTVKNHPCLQVADTLSALGDLAAFLRRRRRKPFRLAALTGSNGKTTTKEMIVRIVAGRYRALATQGNLNNLVGLPLTMFRLEPRHNLAVLEMGTSLPGEIARLTEIAAPDIALITNIGPAHLEGLGNLEGVARAKGELFAGLNPQATAVVNLDDPLILGQARSFAGRHLTFGLKPKADVSVVGRTAWTCQGAVFSLRTPTGTARAKISLLGRHNLANALAAAAVGAALDVPVEEIAAGLEGFQPYPGRLELKELPGPIHLLDDTYNANPISVQAAMAAMRLLGKTRGRTILALGDMLELGPQSRFEHDLVGRAAAAMKVDLLAAIGPESRVMAKAAKKAGLPSPRVKWFPDSEQAAKWLSSRVKPGDCILVKGSRGMRMEKIVQSLPGEGVN
jgi:UDP-N-acetylmuramoyl-tripeptide--D-alanyl-D-alanine ligase